MLALSQTAPLKPQTLHEAVFAGDSVQFFALLDAGVDPNSRDREGRTALHLATMAGYVPWVQALLRRGAEVNAQDNARRTPLYHARGPVLCVLEGLSATGARPREPVRGVSLAEGQLTVNTTRLNLAGLRVRDLRELLGQPAVLYESSTGDGWLEYDLDDGNVLVIYTQGGSLLGRTEDPPTLGAVRIIDRCADPTLR